MKKKLNVQLKVGCHVMGSSGANVGKQCHPPLLTLFHTVHKITLENLMFLPLTVRCHSLIQCVS